MLILENNHFAFNILKNLNLIDLSRCAILNKRINSIIKTNINLFKECYFVTFNQKLSKKVFNYNKDFMSNFFRYGKLEVLDLENRSFKNNIRKISYDEFQTNHLESIKINKIKESDGKMLFKYDNNRIISTQNDKYCIEITNNKIDLSNHFIPTFENKTYYIDRKEIKYNTKLKGFQFFSDSCVLLKFENFQDLIIGKKSYRLFNYNYNFENSFSFRIYRSYNNNNFNFSNTDEIDEINENIKSQLQNEYEKYIFSGTLSTINKDNFYIYTYVNSMYIGKDKKLYDKNNKLLLNYKIKNFYVCKENNYKILYIKTIENFIVKIQNTNILFIRLSKVVNMFKINGRNYIYLYNESIIRGSQNDFNHKYIDSIENIMPKNICNVSFEKNKIYIASYDIPK